MNTVLYARYSSQLQNSRSIADQLAVLRARCRDEGWPVLDEFTDAAISGAAGIGIDQRPGLAALIARVEAGGVDQVLAESTDRIARHQGDAFAFRERIDYAGARLFTLADGEVDDITGTFKGLMDARFRKDLGAKIKRGQRGSVGEGRAPAGKAYGYRVANRLDDRGRLVRGLREIVPEEAAIVRRVFAEYVAGHAPRAIAARLNAEGVAAPSGGKWRASTLTGDRVRFNGMLQNRLYVGELVHNRTSKVVDPATRATRIRANPRSDWIVQPVPEQRIVQDAVFAAAEARRMVFDGVRPERQRRPKHLLSGLVVCGSCGNAMTVVSNGYWGCTAYREGACTNDRRIRGTVLVSRVLAGLRETMLDPDYVAEFVREYHAEYARRSRAAMRERAALERRHAEAEARIGRLVDAIADGSMDMPEIKAALQAARADRDALAEDLASIADSNVVALHPRIADDYRAQVDNLVETLASPEAALEVVPQLRALIDHISATSGDAPRSLDLHLTGRLSAILALATGQKPTAEPITLTCGGHFTATLPGHASPTA